MGKRPSASDEEMKKQLNRIERRQISIEKLLKEFLVELKRRDLEEITELDRLNRPISQ